MAENSAISWTHHTFNPWIGCFKVSPACTNCYAEATDKQRRWPGDPPARRADRAPHWGKDAPRRIASEKYWNDPMVWDRRAARLGVRYRVFCGSMCDWAEDRADLVAARARLFRLILDTPNLDWLMLTKRAENLHRMLPWMNPDGSGPAAYAWPNVWVGVTAENNAMMEQRLLDLRSVPAAVRFVSGEPLLEDIADETWDLALGFRPGLEKVHWLIVGDESGHGARHAEVEWIRRARDAAIRHDVRFHFKQWANLESTPLGIRDPGDVALTSDGKVIGHNIFANVAKRKGKIHLPVLDNQQWAEFPR